jgi:hypothetical protein
MRLKIVGSLFSVLPSLVVVNLLVSAAFSQDAAATTACSNATLSGHYGVVISGFVGSSVLASGGQITANGKGGVVGTWTINIDGNITTNVPLTGSYALGKGCTGHATLRPTGSDPTTFNIIVDSGGKRIEMIVTETGQTQSGYALAQGSATCSLAGAKGTWGWLQSEAFLIGDGPGAFIGQMTLDGTGKLQARAITESANGSITAGLSGPGSYTMGSNCVGTLTIPGGQFQTQLVIVNGGQEMLAVGLVPNTVNYQTAIRQ